MNHRQGFKGGKVGYLYGNNGKAIGFRKMNKTRCLTAKIELPKTYFYGKLPRRNYTKKFLVGRFKNGMFNGLGQRIITVEKPDSSVSIKQIAAHLHIVLEVFKWFVKICCHFELPFCTAKYRCSMLIGFCRGKG